MVDWLWSFSGSKETLGVALRTMSICTPMRKRLVGVLLIALFGMLLLACYPDNPQSTFDATGPVAQSQLDLFWMIFWAALVVFIVVEGVLVYTIIRYRRKSEDYDPPQTHGNTVLEISWTILPAIILAIVAVPTVTTIFDNANSPSLAGEPAIEVEAVGYQWWWEFKYDDPNNPGNEIVTANEMHIPVDTVVNVTLTSPNVLHSFWIPKIAGKVDVVPNNINKLWIKAEETGSFLGQCAEFCGVAHANMRFRVIVESSAEFDAWLAAQDEPALEPVDPLAIEGKTIFEGNQAQCWTCHTVSGSAKAQGTVGPNLTHVGSRTHIASGIRVNDQKNLREWIADPDRVKPGNLMAATAKVYTEPTSKLTDAQVSALVRYLQGLK